MAGDRRSQEECLSIVLEVLQTRFQFLIFGRCPVSRREIGHDYRQGLPKIHCDPATTASSILPHKAVSINLDLLVDNVRAE